MLSHVRKQHGNTWCALLVAQHYTCGDNSARVHVDVYAGVAQVCGAGVGEVRAHWPRHCHLSGVRACTIVSVGLKRSRPAVMGGMAERGDTQWFTGTSGRNVPASPIRLGRPSTPWPHGC